MAAISAHRGIQGERCCVEPCVEPPGARPFRGSDAVRSGGLTRGELFGPTYRRVGHDTYVEATAPASALARIDAALTATGPASTAIGWSACTVLGLDVARGPKPVEVAVVARQPRARPGLVVRYRDVPDDEVTVVEGLRVTTAVRTAFDLARRSSHDPAAHDAFEDAVVAADALGRLGRFGGEQLAGLASRHRGARGVRAVGRVAALMNPLSDSPPESRLRVRLSSTGLPPPVIQHVVPRDTRGNRHYLLDLAWPSFGVAVEYDGKDHALADRRGLDIDRLDELRRAGWLVIVVTAVQLARPGWVADRVREALVSRGWTG